MEYFLYRSVATSCICRWMLHEWNLYTRWKVKGHQCGHHWYLVQIEVQQQNTGDDDDGVTSHIKTHPCTCCGGRQPRWLNLVVCVCFIFILIVLIWTYGVKLRSLFRPQLHPPSLHSTRFTCLTWLFEGFHSMWRIHDGLILDNCVLSWQRHTVGLSVSGPLCQCV